MPDSALNEDEYYQELSGHAKNEITAKIEPLISVETVGNNSQFVNLFMAKHSFIHSCDGLFNLPSSLFGFQLFLFIYLQYYNP